MNSIVRISKASIMTHGDVIQEPSSSTKDLKESAYYYLLSLNLILYTQFCKWALIKNSFSFPKIN